ncbi:MAG: hypothetical protein Q9214_004843 [Letrouitia sp. 1 TL-2023]
MTMTVSRSTTDATLVVPEAVTNNETNKHYEPSWSQLAMQRAASKARTAGQFVQNNVSLPSWLAIIASMVMGVLGLRYAYLSQVLASQSMELAKWTAMKDFQESCSAAKASGATISSACEAAISHALPHPPLNQYDTYGNLHKRLRRDFCFVADQSEHYSTPKKPEPPGDSSHVRLIHWIFISVVVTLAAGTLLVRFLPKLEWRSRIWARKLSLEVSRRIEESSNGRLLEQVNPFETRLRTFNSYENLYHNQALSTQSTVPEQFYGGLNSLGELLPPLEGLRQRNGEISKKQMNIWDAAAHGDIEQVMAQLEKKVNIDSPSSYWGTPLAVAARKGRLDMLHFLLNKGADVNQYGGHFGYALQAAAYEGHERIVETLIRHGANINSVGGVYGTALQAATTEGQENIVRYLLKHGARPKMPGGVYGSAMRAATTGEHMGIVKLLEEYGASPDEPEPGSLDTSEHAIRQFSRFRSNLGELAYNRAQLQLSPITNNNIDNSTTFWPCE